MQGRDLGSVIHEIQRRIKTGIQLPSGYFIEYGGPVRNSTDSNKWIAGTTTDGIHAAPTGINLQLPVIKALYSSLAGPALLEPPLLTRTPVIYSPSVTLGPLTLSPPVLTGTASIFEPDVTTGAITISAPLVSSPAIIFSPAVEVGSLVLDPPLLIQTATIFEPVVTTGAISLTPDLLVNVSVIFSPSVDIPIDVQVPLLTRNPVVYSPVVTQTAAGEITLKPPLISRKPKIFPPGIATGQINIGTVVSTGAVSIEIAGYALAENQFVRTSVTSSGTTVNGEVLTNIQAAGIATVVPDSLP